MTTEREVEEKAQAILLDACIPAVRVPMWPGVKDNRTILAVVKLELGLEVPTTKAAAGAIRRHLGLGMAG